MSIFIMKKNILKTVIDWDLSIIHTSEKSR